MDSVFLFCSAVDVCGPHIGVTQLFRFGMDAGLADLVLPVLASIGVSTLVRPAAPAAQPAVVFCDCPAIANWFVAGLLAGFVLGVLCVVTLAALLRPSGFEARRPAQGRRPAPVVDEVFFDVAEVLEPPVAAYR